MTINDHEWALLDRACARVPSPAKMPAVGTDSDYPDYISNLLLTVLESYNQNLWITHLIESAAYLPS